MVLLFVLLVLTFLLVIVLCTVAAGMWVLRVLTCLVVRVLLVPVPLVLHLTTIGMMHMEATAKLFLARTSAVSTNILENLSTFMDFIPVLLVVLLVLLVLPVLIMFMVAAGTWVLCFACP